jgi:hypothetical protein
MFPLYFLRIILHFSGVLVNYFIFALYILHFYLPFYCFDFMFYVFDLHFSCRDLQLCANSKGLYQCATAPFYGLPASGRVIP